VEQRQFLMKNFLKGNECFHFARKFLDNRKPKYRHNHDYYELFIVVNGQLDHLLQQRTERLEKCTLVFIRPNDIHALQSVAETSAEIINVSFPKAIAEHIGQRYGDELQNKFFWHDRPNPDVFQLSMPQFERAVNLSNELQLSKRTRLTIEQYLLSIMTRVVDYAVTANDLVPAWLAEASAAARQPEVFREGAAGFVRVACRGHEHVCRVTKKFLGVSPTALINKNRMEYAALMLAGSDLSISQISSGCGIENLSYFYRTFQKQYGSTPKQYRVRNRTHPQQAH
jgi:AraC family cel operon transcriptional repressor